MKKIVLSVIVALIAITANAQVYVGGTFGVGSDKVETEGTEVKNTTFKILPEVGYELNEDWSVGTVVGYLPMADLAFLLQKRRGMTL